MLALDGVEVVPEDVLQPLGELRLIDRRQRLDDGHGRLHHARHLINALRVEPPPPGIQLFPVEGTARTEVDQKDLVARLDQDVLRVEIGVKEDVLEIVEARDQLDAAGQDDGIDIHRFQFRQRLRVVGLDGREDLADPDARNELGDQDLGAGMLEEDARR